MRNKINVEYGRYKVSPEAKSAPHVVEDGPYSYHEIMTYRESRAAFLESKLINKLTKIIVGKWGRRNWVGFALHYFF